MNDISLKTRFFGVHFRRRNYWCKPLLHNPSRKPPNSVRLRLLGRSRSSKVTEFGTNRKLICDFLLVINNNLAPILHCFRGPKSLYSATPLVFNFPTEGFPWDDLRKIFTERSQMAKRRNIAENFNRLSRAHERYRRQTDRQTGDDIANVNVSSRSLIANKILPVPSLLKCPLFSPQP